MSASETAKRPERRGRSVGLLLAFILVIAAGVGIAWLGASPLRGETTSSGLRIRTVEKGEGPFVQALDGVFDDSARHGGPQPMIAGQVIPGFAEALTKMQKGGSYKIHIPGHLAYGANPPPGSPFGPNADLDFDVKIVQIVPNAALMQQGGGQVPGGEVPGAEGAGGSPQQAPQPESAPTP